MSQQDLLDQRCGWQVRYLRGRVQSENIADDGLGVFIDTKGISNNSIFMQGDVACEGTAVQILRQQARGVLEVPVKAVLPED